MFYFLPLFFAALSIDWLLVAFLLHFAHFVHLIAQDDIIKGHIFFLEKKDSTNDPFK